MMFGCNFLDVVESWRDEEAARESRQAKQDRYSEMRRLKDEEREAEERKLVSLLPFSDLILGLAFLWFINWHGPCFS